MRYDFVVIGGNLSGLVLTKKLASEGAKVLLIEADEHWGGSLHRIETPAGPGTNALQLLPRVSEAEELLHWFSGLLLNAPTIERDSRPISTFESGEFRSFLGFGETAPRFHELIKEFLRGEFLQLQPDLTQCAQVLAAELATDHAAVQVQLKAIATSFEVANGRILSLLLNGQKKIQADQFIFCGSVNGLIEMLPTTAWDARALSRLAKMRFWTMVGVDLIHPGVVTAANDLFILDGTTEDEFGPCLGVFDQPVLVEQHRELQKSQWISFLDEEQAEDSEQLGQALKKIKKQIKRAFPQALEKLQFERVSVFPDWGADLPQGHFLPALENLHLGNGQLSGLPGYLGDLERVRKILNDLGFATKSSGDFRGQSEHSPLA